VHPIFASFMVTISQLFVNQRTNTPFFMSDTNACKRRSVHGPIATACWCICYYFNFITGNNRGKHNPSTFSESKRNEILIGRSLIGGCEWWWILPDDATAGRATHTAVYSRGHVRIILINNIHLIPIPYSPSSFLIFAHPMNGHDCGLHCAITLINPID